MISLPGKRNHTVPTLPLYCLQYTDELETKSGAVTDEQYIIVLQGLWPMVTSDWSIKSS